ncbi:MAG: hypothetical protein JWR60_4150 [Polaromonas sp.]|nr:hypothetical protein [Polaromonas sp.]
MDTSAYPDASSSLPASAGPCESLTAKAVSPQQLGMQLRRADAPLLLDVRREANYLQCKRLIAGAIRCAPENVAAFANRQLACDPLRKIVVYCVYGHKVSAGAAAELCAAGLDARILAGGIAGGEDGIDSANDISAWRADALPTIARRADWGVSGEKPSRWVTRARPKIDRIACPWLIRRFIDPQSEFFYVPTQEVLPEAERLGAIAFDLPGGLVSHEGELCSFDKLLAAFDLHDAGLVHLARIVRGADTHRPGLAPESAGLLAISLGFSQLHTGDHAMLEAAMPLYDALYAWCQLQATAARQHTAAQTYGCKPEAIQAGSA